jgi:quinol monooxygenase YgiN
LNLPPRRHCRARAPAYGGGQTKEETMAVALIVTLKVQDGKQAEFEAALSELVGHVRANEKDTHYYTFTRKKGSTTEYVMLEEYASHEAIAAHEKTAYFLAALPKLGPCLAGAPERIDLDVIK